MSFVSGLLLALVFAAPAFESHACVEEAPSAAVQMTSDAATDQGVSCPDCGPACANGCCHAPHSAVSSDLAGVRIMAGFGHPEAWNNAVAPPLHGPDGPDRPPRL